MKPWRDLRDGGCDGVEMAVLLAACDGDCDTGTGGGCGGGGCEGVLLCI